jgi:hypothetical protein
MSKKYQIVVVFAVLAIMTLSVAVPSFASREGRRNTALALTGAAILSASHRDRGTAALFGLGAIAAWDRVHPRYHRVYVYPDYGYYPYYPVPYDYYYPRRYFRPDFDRRDFGRRDFDRRPFIGRGRGFERRDGGHSRGFRR